MTSFLIFGFLGLMGSLIYTAAKDAFAARKFDFTGHVSLILFPAFGLIAFIYPIIAIRTGSLPWYGRGAVYMIAFFIVQYLVGLGLRRINMCPWSYSGRGSLGSLIRIQDAPLWFLAGLLIEQVYPMVKSAAGMVGK